MTAQTPRERYRKWYEENRESFNANRRKRYKKDREYREAVLERSRSRRAAARRRRAEERFERNRSEPTPPRGATSAGRRGLPRCVRPIDSVRGPRDDAKGQWVYSTRYLADAVGRSQATVRSWLAGGVLPGSSIELGGRYWFTQPFIDAAARAVRAMYEHNGNGSRKVLAALVESELRDSGVSWVPLGKGERHRRNRRT